MNNVFPYKYRLLPPHGFDGPSLSSGSLRMHDDADNYKQATTTHHADKLSFLPMTAGRSMIAGRRLPGETGLPRHKKRTSDKTNERLKPL